MNRCLRRAAIALVGCIAVQPARVDGQVTATRVIGAAGLSLPTGSFSDRNEAGYALLLGLGMTQRASQLAFRAEGMFSEFQSKYDDGKSHAVSLTGNAVYEFAAGPRAELIPYTIGGLGYYSTREPSVDPFFDASSQSNFGWNIGGGVRFPLGDLSVYAEARYHAVGNVEVRFIPIVFGIVF